MTIKVEHRPSPFPYSSSSSSSSSPFLCSSASARHKLQEVERMSDAHNFSSPVNLPTAAFLASSSSSSSVFERLHQLSPTTHFLLSPPPQQPTLSDSSSPRPSTATTTRPASLSLSSPSTAASPPPMPYPSASYTSTAAAGRPDRLSDAIDELSSSSELLMAPRPPERDSSIFSSSSLSSSSLSSVSTTPRSSPTAVISALRPKRRRPLTSELRQSAVKVEGSGVDEDEDEWSSEEGEEQRRKYRAAVIDQTVHRARELHGLVGMLSRKCNRQYDSIRALTQQLQATTAALQAATHPARLTGDETSSSQPLASLPPSATSSSSSSSIDSLLHSSSATSSLLLSVRVSILVVDGQSSRVLDCNDYMLESTGWERSHLVGRIIGRSYDELMDDRTWQANEPLRRLAPDHVLVDGPAGTHSMVAAHLQEQYPASLEKKRQLYRREVEKINAVWRSQLRDGYVYEMSGVTYVSDWTDVDDGRGGVVQRPHRVVWVVPMWDCRRVDDDDMCPSE